MTPEQTAAFGAANLTGLGPLAPGDVLALVAGLVFGAVLLWFAWVLYRSYEAWGRGRMDACPAPHTGAGAGHCPVLTALRPRAQDE